MLMKLVQNSTVLGVHSFSKMTAFCRMTEPLPSRQEMQESWVRESTGSAASGQRRPPTEAHCQQRRPEAEGTSSSRDDDAASSSGSRGILTKKHHARSEHHITVYTGVYREGAIEKSDTIAQ